MTDVGNWSSLRAPPIRSPLCNRGKRELGIIATAEGMRRQGQASIRDAELVRKADPRPTRLLSLYVRADPEESRQSVAGGSAIPPSAWSSSPCAALPAAVTPQCCKPGEVDRAD